MSKVSQLMSPTPHLLVNGYTSVELIPCQLMKSLFTIILSNGRRDCNFTTLEHKMERARLISAIVLRIRNQIDLNVRQPLARIILPIKDEVERDAYYRCVIILWKCKRNSIC